MSAPMPRSWTAAAAAWTMMALAGCGGGNDAAVPPPGGAAPTSPVAQSQAPARPQPAGTDAPAPAAKAHRTAPAAPESPLPAGVEAKTAIATVNGTPITADKVYSIYAMNKDMLAQRGRKLNPTEDQQLKAQSLQVVVADELLYQAARTAGIKVGAAEIDAGVKDFKAKVGSEENYKNFMHESGMTETDVRNEIERNLQTESFRKSLLTGKHVTDEQAKSFYEGNKEMFRVPEQVHAQFILLKVTEKDPESIRADAKKRAEDAARRAASGEDFAALAKEFSQDTTASKGGDIGFFPRGVMFPKFEEVAFSLKAGQTSPVFETPKGFNVLKVLEKKPAAIRPFEEIKTPLLLDMGRAQEQAVIQTKLQQLANAAKITVLDPSFKVPEAPAAAAIPGSAPDPK